MIFSFWFLCDVIFGYRHSFNMIFGFWFFWDVFFFFNRGAIFGYLKLFVSLEITDLFCFGVIMRVVDGHFCSNPVGTWSGNQKIIQPSISFNFFFYLYLVSMEICIFIFSNRKRDKSVETGMCFLHLQIKIPKKTDKIELKGESFIQFLVSQKSFTEVNFF